MRAETDRPPTDAPRAPDVLPGVELGKLRAAKPRDYAIRFALGATVSIGAAIASKTVGAASPACF